MNRTLALGLLAATVMAPAHGAAADPTFPAPPVATEVLEQNRGGFIVADGLTIGFGAVVRTFVNGQLVLQTQMALGPGGLQAQGSGSGPAPADVVRALSQLGLDPAKAGDQVFTTADGATTAIHRVTGGQLANILLNTGSDRDLRQEMDVTVLLPGFEAFQADIRTSLASQRVSDDMAAASATALGR